MRCTSVIKFILLFSIIHSGEVDHFMVWGHEPSDCSDILNEKFNLEIQKVLDKINSENNSQECECTEVSGKILKSFGLGLNSRIEKWMKRSVVVDKFPSKETKLMDYYKRSIYYRKTWNPLFRLYDFLLIFQLDEVVNVDGISLSLDKITHFTASGYFYYKRYLKSVKKGQTHEEALQTAINSIGLRSEKGILGRLANGIFSYSDLESNFQGLMLALDLCNKESPQIILDENGWYLTEPFDIRKYVNPYWDESFYQSAYFLSKVKLVPRSIKKYCKMYQTEKVSEQFDEYKKRGVPSYSVLYLNELIRKGEIPDPESFTIQKVCEELGED